MRRAPAFVLALVLTGCPQSVEEGLPVQIVAVSTDPPDYGVLEIWEGECDAEDLVLRERRWFPGMTGMTPPESLQLPDGEAFCVRVYAISRQPETPGISCSVVGRGEETWVAGVTEGEVLRVRVEATSDDGPGVLSSERDRINFTEGPALCPPRSVAPFEGERIGQSEPRFLFGAGVEGARYCVEVRDPEGEYREERELVGEPVEDMIGARWGDALSTANGDTLTWRVRACPGECPSDGELVGEGTRCTAYSAPRTLVPRPWGDVNGDGTPDFAISVPGQPVHLFRSTDEPAMPTVDDFEICGRYYRRVDIIEERPTPIGCNEDGPIPGPPPLGSLHGFETAMIDLVGDSADEVVITAPNCQLRDQTRRGGAMYVHDGRSLDLLGSPVFQGGLSPTETFVYALDLEATYRDGAKASVLSALGAELPSLRQFVNSSSPGSGLELIDDPLGLLGDRGWIVGHGDVDANGYADLVYRERVRRTLPPSEDDDRAFDDRLIAGLRGGHATFAGDRDGNGRAEVLLTDGGVDAVCNNTVRLVELDSFDPSTPFVTFSEIDARTRTVPRLIPIDCSTSTDPACDPGGLCEGVTACLLCGTPPLSDGSLATVMPLGASWAPGPDGSPVMVATSLADDGTTEIIARGTDGTETLLRFNTMSASACIGILLRGNYDLDGDGRNELFVLDPGAQRLWYTCGDEEEPVLRRLQPMMGLDPYTLAGNGCLAAWSIAP